MLKKTHQPPAVRSVGCPAFVDNAEGVVLKSLSLGWTDVRVVDELEKRSGGGVAFTLDKLADLAIHAERKNSEIPSEEGVLLLYGEMGVGGSFQKHSEILRGDAGMGGQFGHLTVNHDVTGAGEFHRPPFILRRGQGQ